MFWNGRVVAVRGARFEPSRLCETVTGDVQRIWIEMWLSDDETSLVGQCQPYSVGTGPSIVFDLL